MAAYISDDDFSDNLNDFNEEFKGFTEADIEPRGNTESDVDISSEESDADSDSDEEFFDTVEGLVWKEDNFHPVVNYQFQEITEKPGPTNKLHVDADPISFFRLILELDFFNKIKDETNRYARLRQETVPDPSWKPVELEDIETFFGLSILMGINKLPEIVHYWSTDESLGNDFIKKTMSRNRYQSILRYLHVNDSSSQPERGHENYDKLYKVRPLLDHLQRTFLSNFKPGKEISVDEAMVKFKGRLGFIQYMPMKPVKRGVKVWMSACPTTAYAFTFDVYTGKKNDGTVETGLGHKVVMNLTEPMQGAYRQIYFDNFFTSPQLQLDLLKVKTFSCGTIRPNRKGFPDSLKKVKQKRGEAKFAQCGDMVACTWQDKRSVNILSTNTSPEMQLITRNGKGGNEESVTKPCAIVKYNNAMGGVDRHDQLRSYYDLGRTSVKWWRYLFWWFLNSAIVNSYILYKLKRSAEKKTILSHFKFRHLLAKQLCGGRQSTKGRVAQKRKIEKTLSVDCLLGHQLVKMEGRKRSCKLCLEEGKKTEKGGSVESTFGCRQCNVNLCKVRCFVRYHEKCLLKIRK